MATNPYDLSATANPYLANAAQALTSQVTNNLNTNVLPGIDSNAIAAGGYGGSRQGVADSLAIGQSNLGLSSGLASLYNNALGQNLNFYSQQRGLDQSGAQLGANLYNAGNAGYLGQGTGITGIGNTLQQAPWTVQQNAGNIFSQYSGLGGSQTQTLNGNPLGAAIGGGLAGAQLGQNLGLGGTPQTVYDPYNYGLGSAQGLGGPATAGDYSDVRLKKNVVRIGTTAKGSPWYRWDWKTGGSSEGVLAHEVMHTGAVSADAAGMLMVDYTKV